MRCSVSPITAGCSCSSFSMKWRKLPLPIAAPVSRGQLDLALHLGAARRRRTARPVRVDHRPVAVLQIGDALGQRRQRQRVGADEHLVLAEAHRQRRAVLRADHQLGMAGEDHRQRIGALQPARAPRRPPRPACMPRCRLQVDQLRHRLGVGLGGELLPRALQLGAQLGVVLDDAVVHHGDARGAVRMGVALGRRAVRRPARVADAGGAGQRRAVQRRGEVAELALGAAALDLAVDQGGDAGAVIAAIFQPPQRLQDAGGPPACAPMTPTMPHISVVFSLLAAAPQCRRAAGLRSPAAPRANASASAATSSVITLPAATMAPSPTVTGATSAASEPMKASRADRRAVLGEAVVVAGDGAGADIGARADRRHRRDRSGGWPWRRRRAASPSPRRNCRHARCAPSSVPGRSRANGPTIAPGPTRQPSRWLKARISAPARDRDARPEHHVRADRHVRRKSRVGAQEHRCRVDHASRRPPSPRARSRACTDRLGRRQFGARVDAAQLVGRRLHRGDRARRRRAPAPRRR